MSSRRTISNTFTVTTMDDPVSVQAQYSPDKVTVHTTWQNGDLYMRTRESNEATWSEWHKIVGESGNETNYTFALSANKVSRDGTSSTAPSDIAANAWQDAPMATTTQKPYLWSKVQKKDGNGNNVGSATYIRLTGEEGKDGLSPNPNILLRTVFDRGIDKVKEKWEADWSYVGIDDASDTIVDGRKCIRINASSLSTYKDFSQDVYGKLKTSTWYTLSFNYFATQAFYTFIWDGNNSHGIVDTSAGYYLDGVFHSSSLGIDGNHQWPANWTGARHSITFKTKSSFGTTHAYILFRCPSGAQVAICMPKLELGKNATTYIANEDDLVGNAGTSPYFADLDNEMDSIACTHDGKASSAQTVSTKISMFKGSSAEAFTIDNIYRNGTQLSWDGNNNGVWPRTSGSTVSLEFDSGASVNVKDDFKITIYATNATSVTRELHFTINGIRANAIYRLVPSHSQIVKKKDGTYVPSGNVTCSVEKTENGSTSTPSSSEYTLEKSVNGGSYTTYSATAASSITSDLKFRLTVGGVVVDLETIPLVSDGDKGNEGKGYKAVVTRNNFTESNWATYGELGHSDSWSNTSSTRGNCKTGDWFIVVGTATDTKNYHIATYECSNDSGNLVGTCINHQITKDGQSYCFVFTSAFAKTDEDGIVTAGLSGYAYKYVGNERIALTGVTIRYGYIINDSDTYADTTTNNSGYFDAGTWFNGNDIHDYGKDSPSIFAAIIIGGSIVHAEFITISEKGETGGRGKVGRFFYYAGEWNDFASTDSFLVNDAQAPYFAYNSNYWVFNPETNGTYTKQNMGTPSPSSANWKIMTSDFKYLITEALFTDFAKLASAIFSGDWMLSQYGVPSRVISTTEKNLVYMCVKVDGQYPVSDLATLLDDSDLWEEYKGYGYSDSELETVADICKWAVSVMPSNSDDVRYNAIQTVSSTSYQLFGVNPSNLFSVFSPNISLDFLHGKAYLNDCNIKGNLVGRISNPLTRIKNGSVWGDYGVQTRDDYGYTRHYLFINRMPTWNVQIEYMSGAQSATRRLILPVITSETLGTEIKVVNVSGDTITVEGKPESSTYAAEGSYLLDGIQITGYSNDQRTIEMETQTMLKFVSVEIPTQNGEYGWIADGEPQTIKSLV